MAAQARFLTGCGEAGGTGGRSDRFSREELQESHLWIGSVTEPYSGLRVFCTRSLIAGLSGGGGRGQNRPGGKDSHADVGLRVFQSEKHGNGVPRALTQMGRGGTKWGEVGQRGGSSASETRAQALSLSIS